MKTAISTACFYLKEETENALSLIKETGADACSVHLQTFYEYRPEFAKKYAQNLGGAEVCSVNTGAYNFEPQLFDPSRRIRGDGFYWLEQVLRSAQLLGAKKYLLKAPPQSANEIFKNKLQYLSGIYNFCASYGIGLCIENNPLGLLDGPAKVAEIKSVCPQILFSLNLNAAALSSHPYKAYLKEMSGSLAQVVVKNADMNLIKQLKDIQFNGEIIVETHDFANISELKTLINQIKSVI